MAYASYVASAHAMALSARHWPGLRRPVAGFYSAVDSSEIVQAKADGHGTFEIMRRAHTSKPTVWRWQQRYLDEGIAGLKRDKTRPSRVPPLPMETRLKVITRTVQETPPNATHWSRALMAEAMGISPSSVGRIWAEAGLKPHVTKGFKISNDPLFEEKVTDIVGLYLDPPDRAVVLCVDEKSQIQALDRTQPGLPLKKGRAATMTHDYKRHGTTTGHRVYRHDQQPYASLGKRLLRARSN
jgi:transposase